MRLVGLICLFSLFNINKCDDIDKYGRLRNKCQRTPSSRDCLELKSKFIDLIKKCENKTREEEITICQQIKIKFCAVFPSNCLQSSTIKQISIKTTKSKLIKTTKSKLIKTTKSSTIKSNISENSSLTNEEFSKVPFNPDELRERGEYCIRNGKEKKCQDLLNNLKKRYSSCVKNKSQTTSTTTSLQSQQIDCHSFQSDLCKAFPKFPPCIKKKSN
ncbi:unnamed protein product [Rotaria sordida]|uniref:Uncharacterized protein n=1 Tax=Rotaria sordida TaxID=392033 RepID=A0A814U2D6_9BILA|nr:unnamed protein product [Rotaria sordida]